MGETQLRARRIVGFGLTSPNAARLTEFYETVFGARHVSSERLEGVRGGALRHTVQLGTEAVDIVQFDVPGRPYPSPLTPYDTAFQHFALVVSNIELALAQLRRAPDWMPISKGGPQRLPPAAGGVIAFKFQDPDGHPLELLAFPEHAVPPHWRQRSTHPIFLGIDHSAISVRDSAISTAFYQSLGFAVTAQTLNQGVEQANLDGVRNPHVEVTTLCLGESPPHLELLCYRSAAYPPRHVLSSNDVAATRIALAIEDPENDVDVAERLLVDPDGHHLLLVP